MRCIYKLDVNQCNYSVNNCHVVTLVLDVGSLKTGSDPVVKSVKSYCSRNGVEPANIKVHCTSIAMYRAA
jgi:hypothetical protein